MDIKYLGLVAVVQLWSCLLLMIRKWKGDGSMTYSAHAATTKTASIYYFIVFSVHLVLLYIFALKWFVPEFSISNSFIIILSVALTGQMVALLVPTTGGRKTLIHDITAYTMHILLLPLTLYIVFSENFSSTSRIFASVTVAYMAIVWYVMATGKLKSRRLIIQTFYGLSFQFSLMVATFIE